MNNYLINKHNFKKFKNNLKEKNINLIKEIKKMKNPIFIVRKISNK